MRFLPFPLHKSKCLTLSNCSHLCFPRHVSPATQNRTQPINSPKENTNISWNYKYHWNEGFQGFQVKESSPFVSIVLPSLPQESDYVLDSLKTHKRRHVSWSTTQLRDTSARQLSAPRERPRVFQDQRRRGIIGLRLPLTFSWFFRNKSSHFYCFKISDIQTTIARSETHTCAVNRWCSSFRRCD